ncbi:MAG: helix-turn-helix transcriptional regulator [Prevotellaceae bacterium]|jgi:transcriptional regulator with XRE-family HTH domain|nr:helix-turn-helix transcriptional regulator [Prevotellaceae bacterium]
MASLGTKLLNLRHQHKLSQTEIADILDVSQNAYNKWEAGKCKPSADNLLKLSQYYKVDIVELLDDNEKINLSNNEIKGENNIIANTIPTINIQPSTSLMEQVLKMQEQISKLLESQFRLIEELLKKNK